MKWLPWRFLIRRAARAHGFLDPMTVLARLHRFGQPSEVTEPIELLRSGVVFHARGLINSRTIQHNLDWVWPFWVERQFDPGDDAFVPRAFSITHINLTHRNWTAVGWPDCDELPIVDPRGLLTPAYDGWSLDGWIVADDGRRLLPSRTAAAVQRLEMEDGVAVVTETRQDGLALSSRASVRLVDGAPCCHLDLDAECDGPGWLVLALRPYNPEGISFIHEIALDRDRHAWELDRSTRVAFSAPADRHRLSEYHAGDVLQHLDEAADQGHGTCELGMATAAAMFRLAAKQPRRVGARVELGKARAGGLPSWDDALAGCCRLEVPDAHLGFLFEAALRTLVLHSPADVYPGPYTYKRFWFRDSAFIIHALLCAGLIKRAERAIDRFPSRQTPFGFFSSQQGEWDSNGEALWTMRRFCELAGSPPKAAWREAIVSGARWIARKRVSQTTDAPHAGLMPAGFSAEHLGPNDYYYWDNFWSIAGLRAASAMCDALGDGANCEAFKREAVTFEQTVERSLKRVEQRLGRAAMPASPYRRLDAGAIGSLAIGYPLQMCRPDDRRLLDTAEYLLGNCFFAGGFFQDMVHSGINPYLTLHIAQVLLRAGDARCHDLVAAVAGYATPTGQWPEAIHPRTRGGCMGDGQHAWAAAEWILMMRNGFVREEDDHLVVGAGVAPAWLATGQAVRFGPAPTSFGAVSVEITGAGIGAQRRARVAWRAEWRRQPARMALRLPGLGAADVAPDEGGRELVAGAA